MADSGDESREPREAPSPRDVPRAAAQRLSLYLRHMGALASRGDETTSSKLLGEALGISAAQVRKDMGYLGPSGARGIGYELSRLIPRIRETLGTGREWRVAIIGVGNLGSALVQYRGFRRQGFCVAALFDCDPERVGTRVGELIVHSDEDFAAVVRDSRIELAVIAVPAAVAQRVADQLVAAGIRGLFNFAPIALQVPDSVAYVSIDLAVQLEQLSFQLTQQSRPASAEQAAPSKLASAPEPDDDRSSES